jgi:hypothetical protein
MGFDVLKGALDPGAAQRLQTKDETAFRDEKFEDITALGLVLQDVDIAQRFSSSKARPQEWNRIDNLYRAEMTVRNWEGSNEPRSHLQMPLILEVVESLLPQVYLGFFSDKTPFLLTGQGVTTQKTARAAQKVLKWAIKASGFKEEIRKILKSAMLYGNGVGQWGWATTTRRERNYTRDEQSNIVSEVEEVEHSVPTFEYIELGNLLVDSSLRSHDIRNSRFIIKQKFIDAHDLDDMRADERYKNVPTREQLREILAAKSEPTEDSMSALKVETFRHQQAEIQRLEHSSDPLSQPLEILEYWSADRVIVVLQRRIVLRNDENEYDELPFVSCAFIDVLKSFWGLGIGMLLEGEQRLESGVANAWVDSLNLVLSPAWHRKKGVGPSSQNIKVSPGRVINDDGELAPLAVQSVTAEALQALQSSESRARRRVGANFGQDMPNQAMRTAEGVQQFTAGAQTQLQYFIELFSQFVFIPTLEAFIGLCKDNLSPDDIDDILLEDEGKAFDDDHLSIYTSKYALDVLSSTKLAARRAMVSLAPVLMQYFSAAPVQQAMVVQNKKIDMAEFTEQIIDLAGWDAPGLIVDMTPEDQQRAQQMNPQAIKGQMDMMLQDKKQEDAVELEHTKGDVRGGLQVVKHILDQSGKHDEAQRGLLSNVMQPPIAAQPQQPLANQPPQQ